MAKDENLTFALHLKSYTLDIADVLAQDPLPIRTVHSTWLGIDAILQHHLLRLERRFLQTLIPLALQALQNRTLLE